MQVIVVMLKILALVAGFFGLIGGGICSAMALLYVGEDVGVAMEILAISLVFAVPSFFVVRAILRSFKREARVAAAAAQPQAPTNGSGPPQNPD